MTTTPTLADIHREILEERAKERQERDRFTLRSGPHGIPFYDRGSRIIADCPHCKSRIAFVVDFSEGMQGSLTTQCEICETTVEIYVERDIPPVISITISRSNP